MDSNTKCLEVLPYYNFVNEVTDEEEDVLLVAKPSLFTIGTITLLEPKIFTMVAVNAKNNMNGKTNIDAKININTNINTDMKIDIDEPIFYVPHTPCEILIDITPIWIKVKDTKMGESNLSEEV